MQRLDGEWCSHHSLHFFKDKALKMELTFWLHRMANRSLGSAHLSISPTPKESKACAPIQPFNVDVGIHTQPCPLSHCHSPTGQLPLSHTIFILPTNRLATLLPHKIRVLEDQC